MLDDIVNWLKLQWLRLIFPKQQDFVIKLYFRNVELAEKFQESVQPLIHEILRNIYSQEEYNKFNRHLKLFPTKKSGRKLIVYGELTLDNYRHSTRLVSEMTGELFYNAYCHTRNGFPVSGIYVEYKVEWEKTLLRLEYAEGRVDDD